MAADDTLSGVTGGGVPLAGPFQMSDKLAAAQRTAGTGRHYTGPGLGTPPPWTCPTCGRDWQGEPADGCPVCIAAARAARTKILETPAFSKEPPMSADRTGRLVQSPPTTTPDPATLAAAVSPLVAQRGLSQDRLADAIAEAVVAKLTGRAAAAAEDDAQIREDAFPTKAAEMYATYVGLQLVLQALHDGATDPLLPSTDTVSALLRRVEALAPLQEYLTQNPTDAKEPQA